MARFLEGNDLNSEISKILKSAEDKIILISPYIKLHHRYIDELKNKKTNHKLEVILVFGKNENDLSKSLNIEDLEFFKEFPNIEIRYEKRLHAKYYANENNGILTSMNLYDFSVNNNIEAGILLSNSLSVGGIVNTISGNDLDSQAWTYFKTVIQNSELIFEKRPKYSDGFLGTGLVKKYLLSEVKCDKLKDLFKTPKQSNESKNNKLEGHCIKCNTSISFNGMKKPFCSNCGSSEIKKTDKFNYCHYCGENNSSSIGYPVCKKCYAKGVLKKDSFVNS